MPISTEGSQIEALVQALELGGEDAYVADVITALLKEHAVMCVKSTWSDEDVRTRLQGLKDDLAHQRVELIVEHMKANTLLPTIELLVLGGAIRKTSVALLVSEVFSKLVANAERVDVFLVHADGERTVRFDLPSQQDACKEYFSTG